MREYATSHGPEDHEREIERDWGVWCRVSGGVTGTREAWLKQSGQRFYGTQEEAEALAEEENTRPKSPHSFACYHYTAKHSFLEVA